MNTDTPETDASEHDINEIPAFPFVSCNFARKLERERDEARADAAMWKANANCPSVGATEKANDN